MPADRDHRALYWMSAASSGAAGFDEVTAK